MSFYDRMRLRARNLSNRRVVSRNLNSQTHGTDLQLLMVARDALSAALIEGFPYRPFATRQLDGLLGFLRAESLSSELQIARRTRRAGRSSLRLALAAVFLIISFAASAEESMFAFVYTTDLLPQGAKEVEQWVTWRHQKIGGYYNQLEGRTEFEYGLTDRLQVALYANYAWTQAYHNGPFGATTPPEQFADYQVGPDDRFNQSRFTGVSGEAIYRILSPYTDAFGLAVYIEPTIGKNFFELENKIILQKNFFDDLLTVAFNFTYAPEFRYLPTDVDPTVSNWQEETDVNFALAVSYRFIENWSAGFEFLNEREFNSFGFYHESNSGYYLGPTLHYGGERFFVTATTLWQLPWATAHTDTVPGALVNGLTLDNDFERFRFRLKAGYTFGGTAP